MAQFSHYKADRTYTGDEIIALTRHLATQFNRYYPFDPSDRQYFELKAGSTLPVLSFPAGIAIDKVSVSGEYYVDDQPLTQLTNIFTTARTIIGTSGRLLGWLYFHPYDPAEKGGEIISKESLSQQGDIFFTENILLTQEKESLYIQYHASDAIKIGNDREYGVQFLNDIFQQAKLPLQIVCNDKGYYVLQPTTPEAASREIGTPDNYLSKMTGFFFKYQMPTTEIEDSIDTLSIFLSEREKLSPLQLLKKKIVTALFARNTTTSRPAHLFKIHWYVDLDHKNYVYDNTQYHSLYDAICAMHLPAATHEILISYRLTDLTGLDALATFAKSRGKTTTEIGSFAFTEAFDEDDDDEDDDEEDNDVTDEDENFAWVSVISSRKGHLLQMKTQQPISDLQAMNRRMGVEWVLK